jgi:hypothetical protein
MCRHTERERERGRESYEVEGAGKAALDLDELVLAVRGITAESENVLEAVGLDGGEGVIDLVDGHVGAGEVHHGLDADDVLHPVGDVEGEIGGGATGAPSDVAECGVVSHHAVHPLEEVVHSIVRLGREELEREHHLPFLRKPCLDLLNHLHLSASDLTDTTLRAFQLSSVIIIILGFRSRSFVRERERERDVVPGNEGCTLSRRAKQCGFPFYRELLAYRPTK